MKQYMIKPSSGGFGEWDSGERFEINEFEFEDSRSQLDIRELGVDDLPDGIGDIRGLIHNQTGRIFVLITDCMVRNCQGEETGVREVEYFGISE